MIEFQTDNGPAQGYLALPSQGAGPGIGWRARALSRWLLTCTTATSPPPLRRRSSLSASSKATAANGPARTLPPRWPLCAGIRR